MGNSIQFIDFAGKRPNQRKWLVEGMVPAGKITSLYSEGGVGKSFISIILACCVQDGRSFLGRDVTKGNVAYADFEDDAEEFHRRIQAVSNGFECEIPHVKYLQAEFVMDKTNAEALVQLCLEKEISLLIVDSMGYAFQIQDSGSAGETISAMSNLSVFLQAGITVIVIDHQPKGGSTQFGSVYKRNGVRSQFKLEVDDDHITRTMTQTKGNYTGPEGRVTHFRLEFLDDGETVRVSDVALAAVKKDPLWEALVANPRSLTSTLSEISGVPNSTADRKLNKWLEKEKVKKAGKTGKATLWEVA